MTIETFIIAILPSLCVSVIMAAFNHKQTKRDEKLRERELHRKDGERAQLALLLSTAKLAYATALVIEEDRGNNEMRGAIKHYEEAMHEFKEYERDLVTNMKVDG